MRALSELPVGDLDNTDRQSGGLEALILSGLTSNRDREILARMGGGGGVLFSICFVDMGWKERRCLSTFR
jgi:hypothetical protein